MNLYKSLLKPIMFSRDPEKAHEMTMRLFQYSLQIPGLNAYLKRKFSIGTDEQLSKSYWGLNFPNPVGLAAGFDKDGKYYKAMAALGFGFIEIGTVTPRPQKGNPKPRLFRLKEDEALINRMGFNNDGVDAMVKRLENRESSEYILGANIGKNKTTPNNRAVEDYLECFNKLHDYVDYFVVNVSSPNTPGLRELQKEKPLKNILTSLQEENLRKKSTKPILLKVAPDMSEGQLLQIAEILTSISLDGVIATNTTTDRTNLLTSEEKVQKIGNGGLSGVPLKDKSLRFLKLLRKNLDVPIINVGGIDSPQEASKRLDAGADLIQIYTSLIYQGPNLVRNINEYLHKNNSH